MNDFTKDFSLTPGQIWLNAASEGPLPKVAAELLKEVIVWKSSPELLTIPKFQEVPLSLKQTIADLIKVPAEEVILGNSATYGIHLLANGYPFAKGNEIILMQNDFPSDILPWLHLKNKGIVVKQLKAAQYVLTLQEIQAAVTAQTKLICLPLIHSFSGWSLDIKTIGQFCRQKGIILVVNLSQAMGNFDMVTSHCDAAVCAGYKWLLGPYGTGFCWMRKELCRKLEYPQAYWISVMNEKSLNSEGELTIEHESSARAFDVFGTANFFNFVPWKSSISYLLNIGIENVAKHNQALVDCFVDGLSKKKYLIISPTDIDKRTNIIVLTHKDKAQNKFIFECLKAKGIHGAFWKGNIRISPHIYNTFQDMLNSLEVLNTYGS